jgi:DNA polymerase-3 subunit delta
MILAKRPDIDRFLAKPDPGIRAVVIHGKDRSGVAERAQVLCKAITPDLNDPFNVTVLTDSDIDGDEARLEEALTALSMIGTPSRIGNASFAPLDTSSLASRS